MYVSKTEAARNRCPDDVTTAEEHDRMYESSMDTEKTKETLNVLTRFEPGYYVLAATASEFITNAIPRGSVWKCSKSSFLDYVDRMSKPVNLDHDVVGGVYVLVILYLDKKMKFRRVISTISDIHHCNYRKLAAAAADRCGSKIPSQDERAAFLSRYNRDRNAFQHQLFHSVMTDLPPGFFIAFVTHEEYEARTYNASNMQQTSEEVFFYCIQRYRVHVCTHRVPDADTFLFYSIAIDNKSCVNDVALCRNAPRE